MKMEGTRYRRLRRTCVAIRAEPDTADHRPSFRGMSATDSENAQNSGRIPVGISGRDGSEYASKRHCNGGEPHSTMRPMMAYIIRIKTLVILQVFLLVTTIHASIPSGWEKIAQEILSEFLSCTEPIDDKSPCSIFASKAIQKLYKIDDFVLPGLPGESLRANEIAGYVQSHPEKWTFIGTADQQSALDEAQVHANGNLATIAIMVGNPTGHVAIILPGTQQPSGFWNGLLTPNSASFFLNKPKQSYVGKPLSFAFKLVEIKDVKLYGRNS